MITTMIYLNSRDIGRISIWNISDITSPAEGQDNYEIELDMNGKSYYIKQMTHIRNHGVLKLLEKSIKALTIAYPELEEHSYAR